MLSAREKAKTYNSLIILLKGVENRVTTIELRNECAVRGVLRSVDSEMNCHMFRVYFRDSRGVEQKFDEFYVKGPNIRYVHIPKDMDMLSTINSQIDLYTGARARGLKNTKRKQNFNVGAERRASRRQLLEKKVEMTRRKIAEYQEKLKDGPNVKPDAIPDAS